MNLLGEETDVFLHGHAVLTVVSDALGSPGRSVNFIKTATLSNISTRSCYELFSHIDHQHFQITANNQLAGEDGSDWARPDDKDICFVDFVLFSQEIYLRFELLLWRGRNPLAGVPNERS